MRLTPLFVLLWSSWSMIHHVVNAEKTDVSSIVLSFLENHHHHHHQDQDPQQQEGRDLQVACPVGEAFDNTLQRCVVVTCESSRACGVGETCQSVSRTCYDPNVVCHQYNCISSCPAYEEMDPVTGECIPVYCSSANACPAETGRVCLRTRNPLCVPGRPCRVLCCPDNSKCSSLYCAYGREIDADGCPTCDCKACYGYYGPGGGRGYLGGGGGGDSYKTTSDRAGKYIIRCYLPSHAT
jgi:Antistasin family